MDVQSCAACRSENALPFLFCERCGAPRVRLGWLRMAVNLTFAMGAFMGTYLASGSPLCPWDWPLYAFYAFFLWQFMSLLAGGRWGRTLKVAAWCAAVFAASCAVLTLYAGHDHDAGFFVHALAALPGAAHDFPLIFYPAVASATLLVLAPFFIRWVRDFGWHSAYRLLMLALFAAAAAVLLAGRGLEWVYDRKLVASIMPDIETFLREAKPQLDKWLGLFALVTIRLLVFEVFISSAIRGYQTAAHERLPGLRERLSRESGFVRSLVALAQLVECMARSVFQTLTLLARQLWAALRALLRDLVIPVLAMAGASALLYGLVLSTRDYIDESTVHSILRLTAGMAGTLLCAMIFLGCVTGFAPGRIARFTAEFGGWLAPNLLVFFLLTSLSLYLTGRLLGGEDGDRTILPFRIGPLTKADAALLGLLVGLVLWRRRGLLKRDGAGAERVETRKESAPAKTPALAAVAAAPALKPEPKAAPAVEVKTEAKAKIRTKPKAEAREEAKPAEAKAEAPEGASLLERLKARAQETVRDSVRLVSERVQGKPAVVDQLERARQRRHEKTVQLESLQKLQGSIAIEAFEKLWNEARSEMTYLEFEETRLQTELDTLYAGRLMEKAALEGRLAALGAEGGAEEESLSPELRKLARAGAEDREALTKKLEACARMIEYLAPLAGGAGGARPGGAGTQPGKR